MLAPPLEKILRGRYEGDAHKRLVEEAGIDRRLLETMLRLAPILPDEKTSFTPWTDTRRIDGLIRRLRNVAEDVKSVNESPFVVPTAVVWSLRTAVKRAAFTGASLDWPSATRDNQQLPRALDELPQQLNKYADMLAGLRAYQQLAYPRSVTQKGHLLRILVLLVGNSKKIKSLWKDLATLLNAAFDAAGVTSKFTGEGLRTSYSRIVKRLRSKALKKNASPKPLFMRQLPP
jgi:hypothetical protein